MLFYKLSKDSQRVIAESIKHGYSINKAKTYCCSSCQKKFKDTAEFVQHQRNHYPVRNDWSCSLGGCKDKFRTWGDAFSHIRQDHFCWKTKSIKTNKCQEHEQCHTIRAKFLVMLQEHEEKETSAEKKKKRRKN